MTPLDGGRERSFTLPSGLRLCFEESGSGEALLFLHAFPLTGRMWHGQHQALSNAGRILSLDFPGFGASSDWGSSMCTMEDLACCARGLLDELNLTRATVCGLSMGGYVALALAALSPQRLRGLVLISTRPTADPIAAQQRRRDQADQAERLGRVVLGDLPSRLLGRTTREARPELLAALTREGEAVSPTGFAAAQRGMAERPDRRGMLSELSVPVLVVAGDEDEIVPAAESRDWQRAVPGSSLITIPGAGHLVNLERESLFNSVLAAFLAGLTVPA